MDNVFKIFFFKYNHFNEAAKLLEVLIYRIISPSMRKQPNMEKNYPKSLGLFSRKSFVRISGKISKKKFKKSRGSGGNEEAGGYYGTLRGVAIK